MNIQPFHIIIDYSFHSKTFLQKLTSIFVHLNSTYNQLLFILSDPFLIFTPINLNIISQQTMADIECIFESMTTRGSIYISNLLAAQNLQILNNKGIKAILSVARTGFLSHSKQHIPYYLYIPAQDHEDYQLHRFFDETFDFIEKARKETNVLVHCKVGVSRSVTIVIAYLIKKYKYSLAQVINLVLRKRNKVFLFKLQINPNKGFLQQLRSYAELEGIKCDFDTNYIDNLREKSNSKRKRFYSAHKYKSYQKKQFLPSNTNYSVVKENKQLYSQVGKKYEQPVVAMIQSKQDLSKNFSQRKKGKSFEETYCDKLKDIENSEVKYAIDSELIETTLIKKSVSLVEDSKLKRRPSIEQKISKIRDKILKKQHSIEKSPRLKSYQEDGEQRASGDLRSNRLKQQKHVNFFKETTPLNNIDTTQNIQNKEAKWQKMNISIARSPYLKDEYNQKGDLFAADLNINSATLSNKKIQRRMSHKLSNQIYQ